MRLACSEKEGKITAHFAFVDALSVYDVFEEGLVKVTTIPHHFSQYDRVFDALLEAGVRAVVTGAIGVESIEHILGRGMDVYYGFKDVSTAEALKKVFLGRVPKGHLMDQTEGGCQR